MLQKSVFAGAVRGKVFVGTETDLIALTPEGARKLSLELVRLAGIAESLAVGQVAPSDEEVNQKAGVLVMNGCRWMSGAWVNAAGQLLTSVKLPYPEATLIAHQALLGGELCLS